MPGPQLSHQLHLMGKLQARHTSPLPFVLFPQKLPYLLLHGPDFLLKRPGAHAQCAVPHDDDLLRAVAADNAGAVLLRQLVGRALNVHIRRLGLAGVDNIQIVVLLYLPRAAAVPTPTAARWSRTKNCWQFLNEPTEK